MAKKPRVQGSQLDRETRGKIVRLLSQGAYPYLIRRLTGAGKSTVLRVAQQEGLKVPHGRSGGFHRGPKPKLVMSLVADPALQAITGHKISLSNW